MLEQEIMELLNKKPYEVWKKIKSEELKISDYEFNVQALFVNLCVQYGLVPQVEKHFKDNPDFLFKYAKLMGIDLELVFNEIKANKKLREDTEKVKGIMDYLAMGIFHQVISFDFQTPLEVNDFKNGKFRKILIEGLGVSIYTPDKIPEFSKEFEDYMKQEYETFMMLFPSKLPTNCFSIYKNLIESLTVSTDLKKKIVSFMLSKQEFYGFSYIKAIEVTPELLEFEEIYNNLQVKEIAQLLANLLERSKTKLVPIVRYHKFLELLTPILNEAFKNNLEENNKDFVLKIVTAINEDYIASIIGKHDKKKLINVLRRIEVFDHLFANEFKKPNEIVSKILAGEPYEINDRYTLATSKEFINNFDQILSLALNDENVSRDLISAIAIVLINRVKTELGLELEIKIINDTSGHDSTYGFYNDSEKKFYLNPSHIKNGNKTLIQVINTIYHEIEHAKQHQHQLPSAKNKASGINYETYSMVLDLFIRNATMFNTYYNDNYAIYSLEVAARREAAKKTSDIVLKHNPNLKELCENLDIKLPPQSKYIRFAMGQCMKQTLIKSFIDVVRVIFEADENPEYAELEPDSIKVQQLFDDYPFLKNIFYIDVDKHIIEVQPREKIEALLKKSSSELDKDLYRGILVDYEIFENLKNPELGITNEDVLPESVKKLS